MAGAEPGEAVKRLGSAVNRSQAWRDFMDIDTVECDLFRLPVPENVADSARGTLSCFEFRLRQGVRPQYKLMGAD
jgi:hypothetical protein